MNEIALEMNNYNANCNQQTKSNFFPNFGVWENPNYNLNAEENVTPRSFKSLLKIRWVLRVKCVEIRWEAFKLNNELNVYIWASCLHIPQKSCKIHECVVLIALADVMATWIP